MAEAAAYDDGRLSAKVRWRIQIKQHLPTLLRRGEIFLDRLFDMVRGQCLRSNHATAWLHEFRLVDIWSEFS